MAKFILSIAATVVFGFYASPVFACINDRDTIKQERQFKSLYPDNYQEPPAASEQPDLVSAGHNVALFGSPILGVVLLGGAGYLGLTRRISQAG
jgi:hypothetical protein